MQLTVQCLRNRTDTKSVTKDWVFARAWNSPLLPCWLLMAAAGGLTALALPHAATHVGAASSFMPAFLSLIIAADILTALLLFQQYLATGRSTVAGMGSAYVFAAVMIIADALALPGVVTQAGPWASSPSTASWLWTAWHVGFPLMLAAAFPFGKLVDKVHLLRARRRLTVVIATALPALVGAIATWAVVAHPSVLPQVLDGTDYSKLTDEFGPWIIAINVIALIATITSAVRSSLIERWTMVVCAVSVCDTVLTLAANGRFTFGWYASRSLSVMTALIVLAALIYEITRLYRKSEADKRVLEDEALNLLQEKRHIQRREAHVRRVLETAADAYVEIDRHGNVVSWNEKATDLFALGAVAPGVVFADVALRDESRAPFAELLESAWSDYEQGDDWRLEVMAENGRGEVFPIELVMWIVESNDQRYVHLSVRDITARRRAEALVQQELVAEREAVARLQKLDKAKSDFVASISHELRTPLTSTLGYLEMLRDGDAGELSNPQGRMVEIAERNGRRLLSLIEDLLTLSQIEAGAFSVQFRPVDFNDVINDAIEPWRQKASEQSIELQVDMPDDIGGVLPGDRHQLTRALGNILGNAIKFTPAGGKVDVVLRRLDEQFALTISDNGIGIPFEEQNQLFKRFFKSSISVEQAHQGAGLGLTIARAVIEHHGGSIEISSSTQRGTTATIKLPALPLPVPAA